MLFILLADRPYLKAPIIGIPPPTLASKARLTPQRSAAWYTSFPYSAKSALLAVTTCFPFSIALRIYSLAFSTPPISSTTISISGSSITSIASTVNSSRFTEIPLSDSISRSAIFLTDTSIPTLSEMIFLFVVSTSKVPAPTVPNPMIPILIRFIYSSPSPSSPPLRDRFQPGGHQGREIKCSCY